MTPKTYADRWRDAINETYEEEGAYELHNLLWPDADLQGTLTKAAECLRNGVPTTFTGDELDLVRHLMPAHEVHQSGAVRWVLDNYAA